MKVEFVMLRKSHRLPKLFGAVILLSILTAPLHLDAAPDPESSSAPDYGQGAFHRSLHWQAPPEHDAEGLLAFWTHELGSVTRVLVADAAGRNLVLTEVLDVRKGTSTSWLTDDASGWWARLEIRYPEPSETLGEFFRAAESASGIRVRLTWQDGETDTFQQPAEQTLELMAHRFVEDLQEREGIDPLVEKIPLQLVSSIFFLEANLSPESSIQAENPDTSICYAVRGVIEVLAQALEHSAAAKSGMSGASAEQQWTMRVGEMRKGHLISAPELLEITALFQTVENVDPLSDLALKSRFASM